MKIFDCEIVKIYTPEQMYDKQVDFEYILERWYKGTRHCFIVSDISPLKTVCVQWDDGTKDIVPVRMCWRKSKC